MNKIAKIIIIALVILNLIAGWTLNQYQTKSPESLILGASSTPIFNPNFVLSDSTFRARNIFNSESSIQSYLDRIGSPLARYSPEGKPASYWIWSASNGITNTNYGIKPNVNPAVVLAYLEKEQSLLGARSYDIVNDPEVKLKWAMGMGCPDTAKCGSVYAGFVNQLNWGVFQLEYNFQKANNSGWDYQVGRNIKTLDGYDVYLSNPATSSAYRYTPHVYWGNYSLWKIITANGWGVSTQTWSYGALDSANLKNKNKPIIIDTNPNNLKLEPTIGTISTPPPITQKTPPSTYTMTFGNSSSSTKVDDCNSLKSQKWLEGETSLRVKKLQDCMTSAGVFNWKYGSTGYFGSVTKQSLIRWRGYF
jgi:hypothetical protein